jgi:4-amino-4-deoxy-L-arabinose transferase-like glycosyltransferase
VLALLGLAMALRLWGLSWLPSPAGDEGNWASYGRLILRGEPASLDAQAAFVSMLYAYLIAGSMWVFGEGFFAARLVNATAALVALVGSYAILARLGNRRAGLAVAALLALHPWSVAYSRICSVPYALALATMLLGCLVFVAGLRERRVGLVAVAIQVLALGAHFSPLTVVGPAACAVYCLVGRQFWVFRRWATYASVAVAGLHVFPVVRGALGVARRSVDLDHFSRFWAKLGNYLHMVGTGLGGEATLRHFTNLALPPWPALVVAVPVVLVVVAASTPRGRQATPLGGFGVVYLLIGLVLTPLVLAPGRDWQLPANHQDRYLFALFPGFLMCAANAACYPRRWVRVVLAGFVVWLGLAGCGRFAWAYLASHGVDHGEFVFDGGGGLSGLAGQRGPSGDDRADP